MLLGLAACEVSLELHAPVVGDINSHGIVVRVVLVVVLMLRLLLLTLTSLILSIEVHLTAHYFLGEYHPETVPFDPGSIWPWLS